MVNEIIERLKRQYPEAICSLDYEHDPFRLLVMARLSAQCTDERVNIVAEKFFDTYKTVDDIINADIGDIEQAIFSCGLYKTKARSVQAIAKMIRDDFDYKVPDNIDDLLKLPGVGRKIANLILGDVYKKPAIVTDTHCIRISNRLGLTENENPAKVEADLIKIIPSDESSDFCHRLVLFGREYCRARSPRCGECFLRDLCSYYEFKDSSITNIDKEKENN